LFKILIEFPPIDIPKEGNYTIEFYLLIQNLLALAKNFNIGDYIKLFIKSQEEHHSVFHYSSNSAAGFASDYKWKEIKETFTANGTQLHVIMIVFIINQFHFNENFIFLNKDFF
jgi:hypothetical protein